MVRERRERKERHSAGILLFRRVKDGGTAAGEGLAGGDGSAGGAVAVEVFLVHPGGPFFARKDRGAWGVPKGQPELGETMMEAAQREFTEETGFVAMGPFRELGTIRQAGGKLVSAWASEGDCDPALLVSNLTTVEWPPRSGKRIDVPEIDRGAWFGVEAARTYLKDTHMPFVERLVGLLAAEG